MGEREAGIAVGAVVVKDGVLIGHGFNQPISSRDPMADVEIKALRAAAQEISVITVSSTAAVRNARALRDMRRCYYPCTHCPRHLWGARLPRLAPAAAS